jgi:hypothetical protein
MRKWDSVGLFVIILFEDFEYFIEVKFAISPSPLREKVT